MIVPGRKSFPTGTRSSSGSTGTSTRQLCTAVHCTTIHSTCSSENLQKLRFACIGRMRSRVALLVDLVVPGTTANFVCIMGAI